MALTTFIFNLIMDYLSFMFTCYSAFLALSDTESSALLASSFHILFSAEPSIPVNIFQFEFYGILAFIKYIKGLILLLLITENSCNLYTHKLSMDIKEVLDGKQAQLSLAS